MKTIQATQTPATICPSQVNRFLTKGIIFLTSENFGIFASGIGIIAMTAGAIVDSTKIIFYGGCYVLATFTPWALRRTARDIRQCKAGIKQI